MATPKRRSARIASAQRSTESPAPQLGAIVEREEPAEMEPKPAPKSEQKQRRKQTKKPVAAPSSPMPQPSTPLDATPVKLPMSEMHPSKVHATMAPPSPSLPQPSTPSVATPVKLPMSEMHPSKVHSTMAPPSSGLRLGFVDINPDEKSKDHPSGVTQSTPSKTPLPSSAFSFRFDSELGPEARKMMEQLHSNEEVARIKAKLASERSENQLEAELQSRKIAQAKGKASRYSAAHMTEFKKMDSIENHPSLYRGNPDRHTPMKAGIKRSQSKADLEPDSVRSSKSISRPSSKTTEKQDEEQETRTKRLRQRLEDDASTTRPVTRDTSSIPRPRTNGNASVHRGLPRSQTHGNLFTPTKASLARINTTKTPTATVVASPKHDLKNSEVDLNAGAVDSPSGHVKQRRVDFTDFMRSSSKKAINGLVKSATMSNLLDARSTPARVQTPGRFGKVKSILKRPIDGTKTTTDASAKLSLAKTPKAQFADKALPPVPLTTPGRKLDKPTDFTPRVKQISMVQNSPSPIKSGIPRSATFSKIPTSLPKLSSTTTEARKSEHEVSYPDLSAYTKDIDGEPEEEPEPSEQEPTPSAPGAFTFRSDHTIQFDNHPMKGFGGASGQSSIRHVRDSGLFGTHMPGSFPRLAEAPESEETKENKENTDPKSASKATKGVISAVTLAVTPTRHRIANTAPNTVLTGIAHGMSNKKRSRATSDDEDGAERGAKKQRKNPAGTLEGDALVAPRLANKQSPVKKPTQFSHTPTPRKKAGGLTMSRLNALARPKVRK